MTFAETRNKWGVNSPATKAAFTRLMNQNGCELIAIKKAAKGVPAGYMVKFEGRVIGFLDKYRNTKTETHPWKAFAAKLNPAGDGYMYAPEIAFQCFYENQGGQKAAIEFLKGRV